MRIPVRNLWLLQLYASHLYRSSGHELAGAEDAPEDLPALVAQMLADEVEARLRTGLSHGFNRSTDTLRRVRGRIDLLYTARRQLLEQGKVRCRFDEVTTDIPSNRLVKTALRKAATLVRTEERCQSLAYRLEMAGIGGPPPRLDLLPSLRRQRLLANDHRMLALSELLLTMSIPDPDQDEFVTVAPSTDEHYLRRLFEAAVHGFYRHELTHLGWDVYGGQQLTWPASDMSEGMPAVLPTMRTDVTLVEPAPDPAAPRRRIVIDTKFTSVTHAAQYRTTLKSDYLYQIYAYLRSQEQQGHEHRYAEGLLIHPVVDGRFDEGLAIQGHRIRFTTVDLRADARTIREQLLAAISPQDSDRGS